MMPMFQANKLCPDATIIRPQDGKYRRIGQAIEMMLKNPLVEPLSMMSAGPMEIKLLYERC